VRSRFGSIVRTLSMQSHLSYPPCITLKQRAMLGFRTERADDRHERGLLPER